VVFFVFLVGVGVAAGAGILLGLPVLGSTATTGPRDPRLGEVIRVLANNLDKPSTSPMVPRAHAIGDRPSSSPRSCRPRIDPSSN